MFALLTNEQGNSAENIAGKLKLQKDLNNNFYTYPVAEYEADIVIFSGSLGVLKEKSRTIFHPALDEDKLEAIDKIGFGVVDKVYLEFEKPFRIQSQWISFLFKDSINFTKDDAVKNWTRFVVGAHILPNHPNILSLWITGEAAKHMESLDIEEVKKDSMNLLRAFLYNVPGFQDLKDPLHIQVIEIIVPKLKIRIIQLILFSNTIMKY